MSNANDLLTVAKFIKESTARTLASMARADYAAQIEFMRKAFEFVNSKEDADLKAPQVFKPQYVEGGTSSLTLAYKHLPATVDQLNKIIELGEELKKAGLISETTIFGYTDQGKLKISSTSINSDTSLLYGFVAANSHDLAKTIKEGVSETLGLGVGLALVGAEKFMSRVRGGGDKADKAKS